jgi:hypothetical protein
VRISQFAEDEVLKIGYSETLKFLSLKLGGQRPQLSNNRITNIEVLDIEGKEDKEGKVRERLKRDFVGVQALACPDIIKH